MVRARLESALRPARGARKQLITSLMSSPVSLSQASQRKWAQLYAEVKRAASRVT
jgi:hypothetical protein